MRRDETSPVLRVLRRATLAGACCGLVGALALWIYAQSLDTTVTDSNQNLVQLWACVVAVTSLALLSAPLVVVMMVRAVREVRQSFR
jgi:hypothetical protein